MGSSFREREREREEREREKYIIQIFISLYDII